MFIRTGQKRKGEVSSTALQQLREELLRRLQKIIEASPEGQLPDSLVVQASALLRLYCALRGIAAIKLVIFNKKHRLKFIMLSVRFCYGVYNHQIQVLLIFFFGVVK